MSTAPTTIKHLQNRAPGTAGAIARPLANAPHVRVHPYLPAPVPDPAPASLHSSPLTLHPSAGASAPAPAATCIICGVETTTYTAVNPAAGDCYCPRCHSYLMEVLVISPDDSTLTDCYNEVRERIAADIVRSSHRRLMQEVTPP